jgi:hypothetical protein
MKNRKSLQTISIVYTFAIAINPIKVVYESTSKFHTKKNRASFSKRILGYLDSLFVLRIITPT